MAHILLDVGPVRGLIDGAVSFEVGRAHSATCSEQ